MPDVGQQRAPDQARFRRRRARPAPRRRGAPARKSTARRPAMTIAVTPIVASASTCIDAPTAAKKRTKTGIAPRWTSSRRTSPASRNTLRTIRPAATPASSGSKCRRAPRPATIAHNASSTTVISRPTYRTYSANSDPRIAPKDSEPSSVQAVAAASVHPSTSTGLKTRRAPSRLIAKTRMTSSSMRTTIVAAIVESGPRARLSAITATVTVGDTPISTVAVSADRGGAFPRRPAPARSAARARRRTARSRGPSTRSPS